MFAKAMGSRMLSLLLLNRPTMYLLITLKYVRSKRVTLPYIKNRLTTILIENVVANIVCCKRKILTFSEKIEDFIKN